MALAVVEEFARTPDEHVEAILAIDEFRVDVERDRGGVRLSPVGEVDASTIEHLRESFYEGTATGADRVILDLRETTFLDSTGLHFAVDVDAWAKMRGIEFAIVGGPPAIQRSFDLCGLTERLPFVEVPRAR